MRVIPLLLAGVLTGCGFINDPVREYVPPNFISESSLYKERQASNGRNLVNAYQYIGYSQRTHRAELKEFMGIDPVRTEWCAAFVNAVLDESGMPGSATVSAYPLTARSFLQWGVSVDEPKPGDIVVFPRGKEAWQGHVGFYLGTSIIGDRVYYQILGGNQNNKVSIELYPANRAIDIRRHNI